MSDSTVDARLEHVERTLDFVFAADVAKEVLSAVDFEAILADEPAENPVDVDALTKAVGRPVGRIIVSRMIDGTGVGGLAKRTLGSEVGSRVASKTFRVAVETVDVNAATERLVELDEETLPGPALRETLEPVIGDSDVFDSELGDAPAEAGADGTGIRDASGDDHSGAVDGTDSPDGSSS
ncbi:hypothetical protein ACOZ4I_10095 [Haloarcula salina]|uniref:hypothetical protein n=1 Tax=Haloarcula salina TaxID=1429914 RepID=UPI003C702F71